MSQEFFHFCANNKLKETRELWEKGGIDLEFRYAGYTVLLQAASKGYTEVAWWLIEIGANLEAASSDGKTALTHAAMRGHTAIVEALLNAKADKNCEDNKGKTPLDYAKQFHKDNKKLIEMLAQKPVPASGKLNWQQENNIDFASIEKVLGFSIHKDLKEFYAKNTFVTFDGEFKIDKKHLSTSVNMGNWFEDQDRIFVDLNGNDPLEHFEKAMLANFDQYEIYGDCEKEHEKRYILGFLMDDRGQIGLYFNNETGEVDWGDFEYGAGSWEANPRGIICSSIKEFIGLLEEDEGDE